MTNDLVEFQYRKMFKMTAEEYLNEPADKLFTNLYIYSQLKKKEELESKHG
jgi:hypothetical protein